MTDPVQLGLAAAALGMSAMAAWQMRHTVEPVDAEAAFKAVLRMRGASASQAPWHPQGAFAERLLRHPGLASVPGAEGPEHEAFVEHLAGQPDAVSRWAAWQGGEAPSVPDLVRPRTRLGPRFDDAALADGHAAEEAEARWRLRWLWIRGQGGPVDGTAGAQEVVDLGTLLGRDDPAVRTLAALQGVLDAEAHASPLVWDAVAVWGGAWSLLAFERLKTVLGARLADRTAEDDRRWILGVTGSAAPVLLAVMADDAGLRDRVAAVVSVGGWIGGRTAEPGPWGPADCEDRIGRDLKHAFLDTEVVQTIPWAHVVWLDAQTADLAVDGVLPDAQRWPTPGFEGREPAFVEVVDLGVLDASDPPAPDDLRAAIRAVVDLLVSTRVFV